MLHVIFVLEVFAASDLVPLLHLKRARVSVSQSSFWASKIFLRPTMIRAKPILAVDIAIDDIVQSTVASVDICCDSSERDAV